MRPTLIPAKLKLKGKTHNIIFLWNESWGNTDDFFFVWERNSFKPYYRNKIYTLDGTDLYPHYHFEEKTFKDALNEFLQEVPLTRVVIQGRACYLVQNFGDEYWAFEPVRNEILYTTVNPKKSKVSFNADIIKQKLSEYIIKGINPRVKFADSHLLHLHVLAPQR